MDFSKTIAYNIQKHEYTVVFEVDGLTFEGKARCNKADYEHESEFIGYGIATERAMLKFYSHRISEQKAKIKTLTNFVNSILEYKDVEKDSSTAKHMYRQLNIQKRRLQALNVAKDIHLENLNKRIAQVSSDK